MLNEPYEDGPGGNGQYTRKIYHVGSHLPGWIKGMPIRINDIEFNKNINFNPSYLWQDFCLKVH